MQTNPIQVIRLTGMLIEVVLASEWGPHNARNSGNQSPFVIGAGDLQTCMNAGSNSVHAAHSRIISPS